ncbi:MAG: SBBP repeat-containing protein [bacterium]
MKFFRSGLSSGILFLWCARCCAQLYEQAWIRQYATAYVTNGIDVPTAIASDTHGNFYITGYSLQPISGIDYVTLKYDAAGALVWQACYDGPSKHNDFATSICVDRSHNIYVAGTSNNFDWDSDLAIVKYDAAGVRQWCARYDEGTNEIAGSVAVDDAGNVFVCGTSENDFVTIKYDSSGEQKWADRIVYPDIRSENTWIQNIRPGRIAVDRSGSIYAVGWVNYCHYYWIEEVDCDIAYYALIKYDGLGHRLWLANTRISVFDPDFDTVNMALDAMGNIYLKGMTTIVKYDSNGAILWSTSLTSYAGTFAVDASGNVHVAGSAYNGTNVDYFTSKYSPEGVKLWNTIYNGFADREDVPRALAVDFDGNLLVTGKSGNNFATVKYNSHGLQAWATEYAGSETSPNLPCAITTDISGNICVTGTLGAYPTEDLVTIKYDQSGRELWANRYSGEGSSEELPTNIAVDDSGNVYVVGASPTVDASNDYRVIKYNGSGDLKWTARYNGPMNSSDVANAMELDTEGNVYVTGASFGLDTRLDYATIKYRPDGKQEWVARYNGPSDSADVANSAKLDASGNVFVTGWSTGLDRSRDFVTIKYDRAGVERWTRRYSHSDQSDDAPVGCAIDRHGNVYIAGNTLKIDNSSMITTLMYDNSGVQKWVMHFGDQKRLFYRAQALAQDDWGNVYVTGYCGTSLDDTEFMTIKYDFVGQQKWAVSYKGRVRGRHQVEKIALDAEGNIFVAGNSQRPDGIIEFTIVKYDTAGVQQWVAFREAFYDLSFTDLSIDLLGNVYVSGPRYGSLTSTDFETIRFDSRGVEQAVMKYGEPGYISDEFPIDLTLDSAGSVYVVGTSTGAGGRACTTVKYALRATAVAEVQSKRFSTFSLLPNYPNPFNPATTICYTLPQSAYVTLQVYNLTGQEIATLVDEAKTAGEHEAQWHPTNLAGGVYFYRLQAGEFVKTMKLVYLR